MTGIATRWQYLRSQTAFRRAPARVLWRPASWRWRCLLRAGSVIDLPRWDVRMYLPPQWRGVAKLIFAFREDYEPELQYLEKLLTPGQRVVDVGASLGIYTLARGEWFWGWQTRTETLQRLAEADALVHPSLHEQFGYAVLEAMAAGRPVICLDVGGPAVLVQDGCGFRIPVRDPEQVVEDLYRALQRLGADRPLRQDLGARARQRAEEQFSWEAVAGVLIRAYDGVVSGRPTQPAGAPTGGR